MAVNWAVLTAAFLASTVEFVEAFTIVLVIGVTINWRSSLLGAGLAAGAHGNSIGSATIGALAALALVAAAGVLIRGPLSRVPENTLKFVVGIMLTSFGTFWGGEGLGIEWWNADVFIIILIVCYLALS